MNRHTVTTRSVARKTPERRREEAARWFVTLQRPSLSERVLEGWRRWESVPENREAFEAVERMWTLAESARLLPQAEREERTADRYSGSVSVASWRSSRMRGVTRFVSKRVFTSLLAAAAALVLALGVGWIVVPHLMTPTHERTIVMETDAGQRKEFVWDDGTHVLVGPQTSMTATFSKRTRSVVLDRGEALFRVARDPQRPFRVHAGGGTVTAVGTTFAVRRWNRDAVVVSVTEGVVEISPALPVPTIKEGEFESDEHPSAPQPIRQRLTWGQEVTYDAHGRLSPVRLAEADASAAWRDAWLEYDGERLARVVQDMRRYSTRQIILTDAVAGDLRYSGTLSARNIDGWLAGLERIYPELEVITTDDQRVVIRMRAPSNL